MNLRRAISAVGVSTFALSGCSTSYAPKPHPRVAVVMQGGTPVYIREGRVYPGGGFGGDLGEAVQGNAEAERYAKSYRTNMVAGVTTTLAGVASVIGGSLLYVASSSKPDNERDGTAEAIGGTMVVSGIAAYVTGMVLMLNAQPHLWDAVNAYNDSVDPGVSVRALAPPVVPSPNGPYAPYAPAGTVSYGAPPVAPRGAKLAPPADTSNLAGAVPRAAEPPRVPEADANKDVPPAAAPDLDLDVVEAK